MASDTKNTRSERDAQSMVGDLLRRATSPEVLAGVAGAMAAARFTKHLAEDSDETDQDEQREPEETDEAHVADEEEPDDDVEEPDDDERDEPRAEEDEPDDDEDDEDDEEQLPEAAAEPEPADDGGETDPPQDEDDEEREEAADSSAATDGSAGTDDERLELLDHARRYAEQLTGHQVEGFSSLEHEDRGWRIGVEVVELSRVPSTTDVLASYELVLTDDGDFVDFRRGHRYYRNSTDDVS
jgi:hypothetical protein